MHILRTHHLAITTASFASLRIFYTEMLGLPVVGGFDGHDIIFLDAGSTLIELIGEPAETAGSDSDESYAARSARPGWHHLAWEVDDVDATYAELSARGIPFSVPPEDFPPEAPSMRIAFFQDPDGNLLELVQPRSEKMCKSTRPIGVNLGIRRAMLEDGRRFA